MAMVVLWDNPYIISPRCCLCALEARVITLLGELISRQATVINSYWKGTHSRLNRYRSATRSTPIRAAPSTGANHRRLISVSFILALLLMFHFPTRAFIAAFARASFPYFNYGID